jgi:hypothetical protein
MLGYCRGDVDATAEVTRCLWDEARLSDPRTLNQALVRGFYMSAASWVRHVGIPLDMPLYRRFSMNAVALRFSFIAAHADEFDVFENGHFNFKKLEVWVDSKGLLAAWPRTPKGMLATSGKVLERMENEEVKKLLSFLATVDLLEGIGSSFNAAGEIEEDEDRAKGLQICPDGRNRASLFPFGTKTGRNAPRGRAFLFTNSHWMRFLIRPPKGRAIAHLDWVAQELRIAAILSGDPALLKLCAREDPYIELVISLGLAPPGATKKTHPTARKIGKVLTLAMLYGAGAGMVAGKAKMSRVRAADLLRLQRATFPIFYAWSDNFAYRGLSAAPLWSPLGWRFWPQYWLDGKPPDRTCRNFPVQSAAADIMRVAAILMFEAGIAINAIIHDAFLIEADAADIEEVAELARHIMMQATELVIGASIPVSCEITGPGEQFYDEDGQADFRTLTGMLEEVERGQKAA